MYEGLQEGEDAVSIQDMHQSLTEVHYIIMNLITQGSL